MQDLKPRFHASRFHGSEDVEDEVIMIFLIGSLVVEIMDHGVTTHINLVSPGWAHL